MEKNNQTELLTVKEAADECHVSHKSVRRLVERGILERAGLGLHLVLITRKSVERWKQPINANHRCTK